MTFLLFLLSVGVLEYLLRDVGRSSSGMVEVRHGEKGVGYGTVVREEAASADLLALGAALGQPRASNAVSPDGKHEAVQTSPQ